MAQEGMKAKKSEMALRQSIVRNAILESLGIMLLVLGILSQNDTGFASLTLFKNENMVKTMIVLGGVLLLWSNYQIISLVLRRFQDTKKRN